MSLFTERFVLKFTDDHTTMSRSDQLHNQNVWPNHNCAALMLNNTTTYISLSLTLTFAMNDAKQNRESAKGYSK